MSGLSKMLGSTPSHEQLVHSPLYRSLADEEGANSCSPSVSAAYRNSPLLAAPIHAGLPGAGRDAQDGLMPPGTPNEDDAHRLSFYTHRARPSDVPEGAGGARRTPSPTGAASNLPAMGSPPHKAGIAIPSKRA